MTSLDPTVVVGAAAAVLGVGVPVGAALLRRIVAPATLCCIAGPLAGREWTLVHALRIGRSVDSHLRVFDGAASRRHAVVEPTGRSLRVRDLGSVDGVWSDGRRIFDAAMHTGDQFQIGDNVFLVCTGVVEPAQARVHRAIDDRAEPAIGFELEALMHTGHRCTVMRARRIDDGRGAPLIVKYWHDRSAAARSALERYASASHAWHAAHPSLVRVYCAAAAAPQPYIVEEAVIGASLRSRVTEGADEHEIADVLTHLQSVLARLHRQGIVHGALDAGDVLIGVDGRVRLLNAGVQRVVTESVSERDDREALAGLWRELLGRGQRTGRRASAMTKPDVAPSVVDAAADAAGHAPLRLHVRATGKTILVTSNPFVLSRALNPADRRISRWHGELRFRDNAWTVRPRMGYEIVRNGAVVVGESVVFVGDEITLGATTVLVGE